MLLLTHSFLLGLRSSTPFPKRARVVAMAASDTIDLASLLSTCVDAASRGCAEIRAVQAKRDASGGLNVDLKDAADPRSALTEADLAAQRVMVSALREAWPGLRIIGEEDESEESVAEVASDAPPLRQDLCPELASAGLSAPLDELVCFVDPLDGTREFVEGRLSNVQSLVGVARGGRPIAGACGLPFPSGTLDAEAASAVVYGLVGAGTGTHGERPDDAAVPSDAARPIVTTGDSSNALLGSARAAALADGGTAHLAGGAGHKLLLVAEGRADLAIMHFGTSLWDSCAPGAVLMARGGRVTDLFGAPLLHVARDATAAAAAPTSEEPLKNGLGVVASAAGADASARHDRLCAAMRAEPRALALLREYAGEAAAAAGASAAAAGASAAQAVDIARDLDGAPLRASWLAEVLGGSVGGYLTPEDGAFRGMMSNGCRLELLGGGGGGGGGGGAGGASAGGGGAAAQPAAPLPRSVFYKRVVMGDLEAVRLKAATMPAKLRRDVASYAVEARFLGSRACAQLGATAAVRLPRARHVDLRANEAAPIESRFALLLEDFGPADGWRQEGMLSADAATASLATLARLHAFFWHGSDFWRQDGGGKDAAAAAAASAAQQELRDAVWPAGGYWQPSMQPAEQLTQLDAKYRQHLAALGDGLAAHPMVAHVDLTSLGARLQRVAAAAAAEAHPFDVAAGGDPEAAAPWRTLIHGDPKSANLFLRGDGGGEDAATEVALIDFQWSGFGLAATDVAHHVAAAFAPDAQAEEARLLDGYHAALCSALAEFGAAEDAADAARRVAPRAVWQAQYDAALLDMGRLVFAYQWSRAKLGQPMLNRNSYNKDAACAAWLLAKCDAALTAAPAGAGGRFA